MDNDFIIQQYNRFAYRRHTYQGGRIFYPYVQWKQEEERDTNKGWEVCIQWKYGSSTWNQVKDINESLPVQLSEYAVLNKIVDEPAFA